MNYILKYIFYLLIIINFIYKLTYKPLIIAHRGFKKEEILEETYAAYDKALEFKPDYLECDVRVINSELVISHDLKFKHEEKNISPIKFEEWFEKYKDKANLFIEYKKESNDVDIENQIINIINEKSKEMNNHIILQTFYPDSYQIFMEAKKKNPKIKDVCYLIIDYYGFKLIKPSNIGYDRRLLFNPLIFSIIFIRNLLGKINNVYTVNKYWEMIIVDFIGNRGIITDRADILNKYNKDRFIFNFIINIFLFYIIYLL